MSSSAPCYSNAAATAPGHAQASQQPARGQARPAAQAADGPSSVRSLVQGLQGGGDGGSGAASPARSAAGSGTPIGQPSLPFDPPEHVQKWLRQEDYNALQRAWLEAEQKACSGDMEDTDAELLDNLSTSTSPSSLARRMKTKRKRQPWKEDFQMLGTASKGAPAASRRYFDTMPAELSPPRQPVRRDLVPPPNPHERDSAGPGLARSPQGRPAWNDQWSSLASRDNDGIHRHLRHYFDRRGMEASYRQRPHADSTWLQRQRPRSSQRPSNEELRLKYSVSAPAIGGDGDQGGGAEGHTDMDPLDVSLRHAGSINWGTRCLYYGPDASEKPRERVPWVNDHHVSETEDNTLLNPMLRHYFDADGIESSFRNRGRHYGRPLPAVCGVGGGKPASQSPARSKVASTTSPAGPNRRAPRKTGP